MQLLQKNNFKLKLNWQKCMFWFGMLCLCLPALTSNELYKIFANAQIRSVMPLMAISAIALCCVKKGMHMTISGFDLLLICMMLFIIHNNYFVYKGMSIALMQYMAVYMAAFLLQRRGDWINTALKALSCVYIVYAVCTIWFYFDSNFYMSRIVVLFPNTARRLIQWYNEGCMAGLVEHYSINGMLLANGIILYAAGMLNPSENKILNRTALVLCCIAMLLTGKRGPLLFAALALFVLYFLHRSNQKNIVKKILQVAAILLAVAGVLAVLYQYVPELVTFIARFQETADAGDVTLGRAAYWDVAISQFSSNVLFGAGWNRLLQSTLWHIGFEAYAHNIYVELLAETGIVGTVVFLAWFIGVLTVSLRFFIKVRRGQVVCNPVWMYHMAFSIGMQIFFLAYGTTGNPLYDEIAYIPYFIACAIALYYNSRLKQSKTVYVESKTV